MHVVHIMTRLLRAGSEENVLLTSKGQMEEGCEVTLIHGGEARPDLVRRLAPDIRLVEVPSLVRPVHPLKDIRAFGELRQALRDLKPDVVHTHQSKAGILGRLAAAAENVPRVVHGVHILPFVGASGLSSKAYLLAERAAARVTDGYVHVSQGMQSGCISNGVGKRVAHEVIPSGFDIERFRNANLPGDWRAILGVAPDAPKPPVILMVAALEPRKRHLDLLPALLPVVAAHPDTRILFAGDGPLKGAIEAKARDLGIGEAIRMVGYRSDPERLIALSDMTILSSGQEGMPRVVLQSLVGGRPVVAFDLPGIEAVVEDGKNGFLIGSDDWGSFGAAILKLVHEPLLRDRMSARAVESDLSAWDWRKMGSMTNAFYRSLNSGGPRVA
ncbi:MAG: glycosyltransferase family 4 protein [Pseudomonadota bacterium]